MEKVERLIENFVPERYELELRVDKGERRVEGVVRIFGEVKSESVRLHAKDLKIEKVSVSETVGHESRIRELEWKMDGEVVEAEGVERGVVELEVIYSFELNEQMHGAYLSTYEYGGRAETVVATQFESHYAREVLPCVDEPEAKAVFELTVIVPDDSDEVLGNMPVAFERTVDGVREVHFEETPRMSTYLLAFVVGKFQKVEAKTERGVEVRTWASLAQPAKSLVFANEVAVKTLDFFEDYFGVEYPLPKCDQVALPDFEAGAMENWGLVTYREMALLVDPALTSVDAKRWVATVITHELSHMWFGNLVTMKWWDDLWLNESFASIMEYVAGEAVCPEMEVWKDYYEGFVVAAMRRDCLSGVQAVKQDVAHPDEIQTLFDGAIVYAKGARLIYMLMELMGEEKFRAGMREYFREFAYENTVEEDLWGCLQEFAEFDVKELMEGWIYQPGYPVVEVGEGVVRQRRFVVDEEMRGGDVWKVPLFAGEGVGFLAGSEMSVGGEVGEVNRGMRGHYVTKYSDEYLKKLMEGELDATAKLKLLMDQSLLAKTELVESVSLFDVVERMRDETDDAVWSLVSLAVADLKVFVEEETEEERKFKKFVKDLAEVQYERLGWDGVEGEGGADVRLRCVVVGMRIYGEDEEAIGEALRRYDAVDGDLEKLDKETRAYVVAAKVKWDFSEELGEDLLEKYQKSVNVEVRDDICGALVGARNEVFLGRMLGLMKDQKMVRSQDVLRWYMGILRNPKGREMAWKWLRDEWGWVAEKFGDGKGYDYYPRGVAAVLKTEMELAEYREFFEPMLGELSLKRNIEIGMKEIEARVRLIEGDGVGVRGYLRGL
ncbi:M1 family metallopeptidase [Candidatus Saccharibacteria bacterium]|nr:M1 family metallopeptidase [Candidatus Saccharibacteria bacterium]